MNNKKNKLNSKISWLFNLCQTHTSSLYLKGLTINTNLITRKIDSILKKIVTRKIKSNM